MDTIRNVLGWSVPRDQCKKSTTMTASSPALAEESNEYDQPVDHDNDKDNEFGSAIEVGELEELFFEVESAGQAALVARAEANLHQEMEARSQGRAQEGRQSSVEASQSEGQYMELNALPKEIAQHDQQSLEDASTLIAIRKELQPQDSLQSKVGETQNFQLENDTQAQDTITSRIEETQLIDLEKDTQAQDSVESCIEDTPFPLHGEATQAHDTFASRVERNRMIDLGEDAQAHDRIQPQIDVAPTCKIANNAQAQERPVPEMTVTECGSQRDDLKWPQDMVRHTQMHPSIVNERHKLPHTRQSPPARILTIYSPQQDHLASFDAHVFPSTVPNSQSDVMRPPPIFSRDKLAQHEQATSEFQLTKRMSQFTAKNIQHGQRPPSNLPYSNVLEPPVFGAYPIPLDSQALAVFNQNPTSAASTTGKQHAQPPVTVTQAITNAELPLFGKHNSQAPTAFDRKSLEAMLPFGVQNPVALTVSDHQVSNMASTSDKLSSNFVAISYADIDELAINVDLVAKPIFGKTESRVRSQQSNRSFPPSDASVEGSKQDDLQTRAGREEASPVGSRGSQRQVARPTEALTGSQVLLDTHNQQQMKHTNADKVSIPKLPARPNSGQLRKPEFARSVEEVQQTEASVSVHEPARIIRHPRRREGEKPGDFAKTTLQIKFNALHSSKRRTRYKEAFCMNNKTSRETACLEEQASNNKTPLLKPKVFTNADFSAPTKPASQKTPERHLHDQAHLRKLPFPEVYLNDGHINGNQAAVANYRISMLARSHGTTEDVDAQREIFDLSALAKDTESEKPLDLDVDPSANDCVLGISDAMQIENEKFGSLEDQDKYTHTRYWKADTPGSNANEGKPRAPSTIPPEKLEALLNDVGQKPAGLESVVTQSQNTHHTWNQPLPRDNIPSQTVGVQVGKHIAHNTTPTKISLPRHRPTQRRAPMVDEDSSTEREADEDSDPSSEMSFDEHNPAYNFAAPNGQSLQEIFIGPSRAHTNDGDDEDEDNDAEADDCKAFASDSRHEQETRRGVGKSLHSRSGGFSTSISGYTPMAINRVRGRKIVKTQENRRTAFIARIADPGQARFYATIDDLKEMLYERFTKPVIEEKNQQIQNLEEGNHHLLVELREARKRDEVVEQQYQKLKKKANDISKVANEGREKMIYLSKRADRHKQEISDLKNLAQQRSQEYDKILRESRLELQRLQSKNVKLSSSCGELNKTIGALTNDVAQEKFKAAIIAQQLEEVNKSHGLIMEGMRNMSTNVAGNVMSDNGLADGPLATTKQDHIKFDTLMTNMISACDLIKQAIPNVAKTFETLTTSLGNKILSRSESDVLSIAEALKDIKAVVDKEVQEQVQNIRQNSQITDLQKQNKDLEGEIRRKHEIFTELKDSMDLLQAKFDEMKIASEKKDAEIQRLRAIPREDPILREMLKNKEDEINCLRAQIPDLEADMRRAKEEHEAASALLEQRLRDEHQIQIDEFDKTIDELIETADSMSNEYSKERAELSNSIRGLREDRTQLQKNLELSGAEMEKSREQVVQLGNEIAKTKEQLNEASILNQKLTLETYSKDVVDFVRKEVTTLTGQVEKFGLSHTRTMQLLKMANDERDAKNYNRKPEVFGQTKSRRSQIAPHNSEKNSSSASPMRDLRGGHRMKLPRYISSQSQPVSSSHTKRNQNVALESEPGSANQYSNKIPTVTWATKEDRLHYSTLPASPNISRHEESERRRNMPHPKSILSKPKSSKSTQDIQSNELSQTESIHPKLYPDISQNTVQSPLGAKETQNKRESPHTEEMNTSKRLRGDPGAKGSTASCTGTSRRGKRSSHVIPDSQ